MRYESRGRSSRGVFVLFLLGLLMAGCEDAHRLDLHLAFDPREGGGEDGPLPAELAGMDGTRWVRDRFETTAGVELDLWRTAAPWLRVDPRSVERIVVREGIPSPGVDRDGSSWSAELAIAALDQDAQRRLAEATEVDPDLFLLVRTQDQAIDLAPLESGASARLPAGTFRTREEALQRLRSMAGDAPERLRFEPLREAERAFWARRNRALVELAIWQLECDPEAAGRLGPGLVEALQAEPDIELRRAKADCASEPRLDVTRPPRPPLGLPHEAE